MNKMQKLTCAKVFKVIFYLLGFPLLLLLTAKDSMVFFDEEVYAQTAKDGITVIAILWLGFTLIQIGLYLVMKKKQALRTVILVALVIVMMLAPIAAFDKQADKKIDEVKATYSDKGVVVNDFSLQKQWFNTLSDKDSYTDTFMKSLNEFIRVYNLNGYDPIIFRARTQMETVPYFVTENGTGKRYDITDDTGTDLFTELVEKGENPVAYNPNGLLYDGYIFGLEYAVNLLIEYNEFKAVSNTTRVVGTTATISVADAVKNKYMVKDPQGVLRKYTGTSDFTTGTDSSKIHFDGTFYEVLTIDDALNAAIETATNSAAWVEYSSTDDFKAKQALADDYVITPDRLDLILTTLLEYLGMNPDLNQLGGSIAKIIDVLPTLLGSSVDLETILSGLRYPAYFLFGESLIAIDTTKGEDTAYNTYLTAMKADEDARALANGDSPRYAMAALTDLLQGLSPALPLVGGLLTDTVVGLVAGLLPIDLSLLGLTDEKMNNLVTNILGLALDPATGIDLSALSTDAVENLLMSIVAEVSFYQHPELKMVWDSQFMSDADKALVTDAGETVDLSRYAWVKYTCEQWGITNGCALATKDGGLLTGKTLGNGTSADDAFTLVELYQLRADLDYMPETYPIFAARRYMVIWASVLAITIFMYTYFYNKERKYGYEILQAGGEY